MEFPAVLHGGISEKIVSGKNSAVRPETITQIPLGTKTLPNSFGTDLGKVILAKLFNVISPRQLQSLFLTH